MLWSFYHVQIAAVNAPSRQFVAPPVVFSDTNGACGANIGSPRAGSEQQISLADRVRFHKIPSTLGPAPRRKIATSLTLK